MKNQQKIPCVISNFYSVCLFLLILFQVRATTGNNGQQQSHNPNGQHQERNSNYKHVPGGLDRLYVGDTVIDMSNKLIQHNEGMGSTYSLYTNPQSPPIYRRRTQDNNRHFVLFPDNRFPHGSGRYIVLKRFKGYGVYGPNREPLYEALELSIKNSARAMVFNWPLSGSGASGRRDSDEEAKAGVDVGEVAERSKRKVERTGRERPDFATIPLSLVDMAQVDQIFSNVQDEAPATDSSKHSDPTPSLVKEGEFNGFQIEPEE